MKTRHTKQTNTPRHTVSTSSSQSARDEILDWLRDAYAMEKGLESSLEKQSRNEDLSPQVRQRAASHLQETRRHAEEIRSTLQALGTDTSAVKTGMGSVVQAAKGIGSMFARDERIKDLLDAYSMEHFEIACYTALAAAAEREGLSQVVELCNSIIPDEQRMAEELLDSLPQEVTSYLFDTETEET